MQSSRSGDNPTVPAAQGERIKFCEAGLSTGFTCAGMVDDVVSGQCEISHGIEIGCVGECAGSREAKVVICMDGIVGGEGVVSL